MNKKRHSPKSLRGTEADNPVKLVHIFIQIDSNSHWLRLWIEFFSMHILVMKYLGQGFNDNNRCIELFRTHTRCK